MTMQLVPELDFGVIYDAMQQRMDPAEWTQATVNNTVTKAMYIAYCRQFPSRGIECDGRQVGGIFFDGHAVHIEILAEFHGRWSILLPEMLRWTFAQKDPIQVAVARGDAKINRFMVRNNWPLVAESADSNTYEMSSQATPLFSKRVRADSPVAA